VLDIRLAHSAQDAALISRLFDEIWSVQGMVSPEVMVASLHNGGYGSVAWLGGEPIGAAFALVGAPLTGEVGLNLHSHAAGVLARLHSQDIGRRIKVHQWQWAKQNGFATMTWTFDPLVRRNAWFNIVKLGVEVLDYHVNFYGELHDGINAGEQSDRVLVKWEVAEHASPPTGAVSEVAPGYTTIATPSDIESLRKTDKSSSDTWRLRQRSQFAEAKAAGCSVVGFSSEYEYVLRGSR
jgi:predicted GNAT superfamily acetyltransferase